MPCSPRENAFRAFDALEAERFEPDGHARDSLLPPSFLPDDPALAHLPAAHFELRFGQRQNLCP